jgi:hypothetical protein
LTATSYSEDETGEVQVVERFRKILIDSPRYGTAFDSVYAYHVDAGTLDELTGTVYDLTVAEPENGKAHLLYRLILSRQSDFEKAEALDAALPLSKYPGSPSNFFRFPVCGGEERFGIEIGRM